MILGLGARDLIGLFRDAQDSSGRSAPIVVHGPRADELAAALGGNDPEGLIVRNGARVENAGAFVLLVETPPIAAEVELLRRATRAGVPSIVVRLSGFAGAIPYVLPEDVVQLEEDGTLPVGHVACALARNLPDRGAALGARHPGLRAAAVRRQTVEAAVAAGTIAALRGNGDRPLLPQLAIVQSRALHRLDATAGAPTTGDPAAAALTAGQNLGSALGIGLACRTLVRRLPVRNNLVDGAVAAAGTFALLTLRTRLAQP